MPRPRKPQPVTPKPGEPGGKPGRNGIEWKSGMGMSITNPSKPKKKRMGFRNGLPGTM
jgi:hypothetical protein